MHFFMNGNIWSLKQADFPQVNSQFRAFPELIQARFLLRSGSSDSEGSIQSKPDGSEKGGGVRRLL